MIRTTLTALAIASTAACVGLAAPAFAQDLISIHVGYSDLNLASTAGAAVLQHRIKAAVDQICGQADNRDLQQSAAVGQCRREVSVGAEEQSRQAVAKARQTVLASAPPPAGFASR